MAGPSPQVLTVDDASSGRRLDAWLAAQRTDLSRARIQALIEEGLVTLDGRPARASARLKSGQTIALVVPPAAPAVPQPEDLPLTVLYQDPHLLVLDKPAGLVVHPGAGRASGTLVNALLHHVRDLSGVGGVLRPGIVHRLDRGTSGLMVVAKDDATHRDLARQFAGRTVQKEYLAVVSGVPAQRQGRIDAAIGRDPVHRQRMSVRPTGGRAASSTYTVLEALDGCALVRVAIHSGRTHQIRVHMASIGHPVVADTLYGGARVPSCRHARSREALQRLTRPALHAAQLAFIHPATGERLLFTSPLPADIETLLAALRASP
jgi:23S rRNA pseudouridine1911/1915/1917 synthase